MKKIILCASALLASVLAFGNDKEMSFGIGLDPSLQAYNHKIYASIWQNGGNQEVQCRAGNSSASFILQGAENSQGFIECDWEGGYSSVLIRVPMTTAFIDMTTSPEKVSRCNNIVFTYDPSNPNAPQNHFYTIKEDNNGNIICNQVN